MEIQLGLKSKARCDIRQKNPRQIIGDLSSTLIQAQERSWGGKYENMQQRRVKSLAVTRETNKRR